MSHQGISQEAAKDAETNASSDDAVQAAHSGVDRELPVPSGEVHSNQIHAAHERYQSFQGEIFQCHVKTEKRK